jgi:phospholipid/cholesterol/gamma-HCH transport system substrate-binding protein
MKLTRSQKVRLGAFVLTGMVLLAGTVIALTGLKMWEDRDIYLVNFTENVSGLEPGAPVKYQGLRVGRVDKMRIAQDEAGAIQVTLSLIPGTALYEGTKAVLDANGLTGLKNINLTPGDPRSGLIAPGSKLPSGESLMDRLTGQAEAIGLKIEIVANQLARWTGDDNRRRAERLLDSLTTLSQNVDLFLNTNRAPLNQALVGVGRATGAFTDIAGNVDKVEADVAKTLAEARTTIAEYRRPISKIDEQQVADTVTAARQAALAVDARLNSPQVIKAVDELVVALGDLTVLIQNTDLTVRAGREDFVATLKYIRQAAEDLREFSRIIAQNPSAIISGRE